MHGVLGRQHPDIGVDTGPKLFRSSIHGLDVLSDVELPFHPAEGHSGADVRIERGEVSLRGELVWEATVPPRCRCLRHEAQVILAWDEARFAVGPERIVVDGGRDDLTCQLLIQPVWAVLLTARGRQALHASAVARNGRGVAVAGASGSGKSTAALALIDVGWELVTDDLLTFDDQWRAYPGPRYLRLRPDRAATRAGAWDGLGKLRYAPASSASPVAVDTLIILDARFGAVRRLGGLEAVDAVLRHIYHPVTTHADQSRQRLDFAMALAARMAIIGAPPRSLSADQLVSVAGEGVTP